ncbi:MAG: DNA repair protein RecN [Treponema sp.]|nr:DNA repair protein RecN [Treponema sp.]
MLEDLTIKDFALIDSANLEFEKGFTVLSGETGAGKSLLIGALSFLLGGKSGVEQIRPGCHEATVSGTFLLPPEAAAAGAAIPMPDSQHSETEEHEARSAREWLSMHGIEPENDRILLRRYVRENGKSGAWIGGTAVTRADLAAFSAFLVDIHGQHEHQSLMRVSEHRRFLDSYAGLTERVASFTALYTELVEKRRKLSELNANDADRAQKIELLTFAVEEITAAKLKPGEDTELEEEEVRLSSYEKLFADIEAINAALGGGEGGDSIISALKRLRSNAQHASSMDAKALGPLEQRLDSAFYELSDVADEYQRYAQSLVFDPERLTQVQERQTVIYNLKKKYAGSVTSPLDEVLRYAEQAQAQLDAMQSGEEGKEALMQDISRLEKQVYTEAKQISALRVRAAETMSGAVVQVLSKLGMNGTRFSVSLTAKGPAPQQTGAEHTPMQLCGPYGMDNVEFLISANPGSPLQPLAKIASGGELSRVMLALKTIFAASDPVGTLVFDEIDTGIGGEIAVSIGSHLQNLAKNKQVLCITHLASIAVYADNQVKIAKGVSGGTTSTRVFPIAGEERVEEIARMLSGDPASSESIEHARAMLQKYSSRRQ